MGGKPTLAEAMIRPMKAAITFALLGALSSPLWAVNRTSISRAEFARALRHADPILLGNVNRDEISAKSIRVIGCIGPDEEPTEFECRWQLRTSRGWKEYKNWLAVDGRGWHLMDQ
jgi:hypothetical protein